VEWFFHSHPSISKRVAAAQSWSRRSASAEPRYAH
jgi:Zn-dependent protease with chaperone function